MRKARVLFVDDEKRVLNSMRGLFRRDFELFLTTEGQDAIDITQQNEIDVIVADQRMPGMNGVQVLEQVKQKSPGTIRILLTGYADLDAIEGSINVGEVFRFLSKPCPPKLLRETLRLAIDAAQATAAAAQAPARVTPTAAPPQPAPSRPASPPQASPPQAGPLDAANDATQPTVASRPAPQAVSSSAPPPVERRQSNPPDIFTEPPAPQPASAEYDEEYDSTADTQQNLALPESALTTIPTGIEDTQRNPVLTHPASAPPQPTEIVMSGETSTEIHRLDPGSGVYSKAPEIGVAVFTTNAAFAEETLRAISPGRNTFLATTLVKVVEVLDTHHTGVLITDFTSDVALLQSMTGTLKQHLPELVTIVISESRDTSDMINLINYGQIFRYVAKPVDAERLREHVAAAVVKHVQFLEHPELVQRHQVIDFPKGPRSASPTINQFVGKIMGLKGRWSDGSGNSH